MLPRETNPFIARAPQRGPGLLVIGISLGLHSAAFAGLLLFQEVTPPKPYAVFAVELVRAADLIGPPRGNVAEQAESPEAAQQVSPEDAENIADPQKPAHRAAGDEEFAASSKALNPSDSLTAEPAPKPIRHLSPPPIPENASHRRNLVSRTHQDASPIAEITSAPEELTEAARPILPAPRRKPSPLDPAASSSASKGRIEAEPTRIKDTSPRSGEQGSPREVAQSAPDRLVARGQQTTLLKVRKVQGMAALPVNVPGGGVVGKLDSSTRMPPRYAGRGLANAPPRYPYLARRSGQEGRAVLRVTVTPDGAAAAVRLHESSGYRLLDKAAIKAIKAWRFIPAKRGGIPVAGSVDVPISFKLTD
ncbi:MAG: TonB family protein [Rhodospirillaceae bacterium]|nr:TonB family protein [Rhodospirillaceae bacterium]